MKEGKKWRTGVQEEVDQTTQANLIVLNWVLWKPQKEII